MVTTQVVSKNEGTDILGSKTTTTTTTTYAYEKRKFDNSYNVAGEFWVPTIVTTTTGSSGDDIFGGHWDTTQSYVIKQIYT